MIFLFLGRLFNSVFTNCKLFKIKVKEQLVNLVGVHKLHLRKINITYLKSTSLQNWVCQITHKNAKKQYQVCYLKDCQGYLLLLDKIDKNKQNKVKNSKQTRKKDIRRVEILLTALTLNNLISGSV